MRRDCKTIFTTGGLASKNSTGGTHREWRMGEGEQGEFSRSVLLMPLPSTSFLIFELRLSALSAFNAWFFMALGEKSAGCVWGGCVCDKFNSLLLLLPEIERVLVNNPVFEQEARENGRTYDVFRTYSLLFRLGIERHPSLSPVVHGGTSQQLVDGGAVGRRCGRREQRIFHQLLREARMVVVGRGCRLVRSYQTLYLGQLNKKIVH